MKLRLLPSPGGFLAFLALFVALGPGLPRMYGSDGDGGRHIRVGTEILEGGAIPDSDMLSHTRVGEPWVLHEWLSQVGLAASERLAGLPGAATYAAGLFTVAVIMTYATSMALGGMLGKALLLATVGMLLQVVHLLPRPHLATTALASVLLFLLVRYRQTGRLSWIVPVPPMFILWANLHGGFPAGLVLLALFVADAWLGNPGPEADRQRWSLTGILAVSGFVTLLNPYGPGLWVYVIGHVTGDDLLMSLTQEFQSPDFHATWGKILLVVIVGTAAFLWKQGRNLPILGLVILLGTLAATLVSARHITLFATLGLPWLASPPVSEGSDGPSAKRSRWPEPPESKVNRAVSDATGPLLPALAIVALLVLVHGPWAPHARWDPDRFPVQAMVALDASEVAGPVFNELEWGGYLLHAHRQIPVFIDGQTDFYGEDLVREYLAVHQAGAGWNEVLDHYGVQWTITRPAAPLNQLLATSREWQLVIDDGTAAVYRRSSGAATLPDSGPR